MTALGATWGGRELSWQGWIALVALALMVFLPGFATLPVIDRDEARFVQASRQMVQTGDYIDIRFQDEARHKKPVGIYWLQSAAVQAFGQGDQAPLWVYRLPSLAGAVVAVLLVAVIGVPLFGQGPALLAAGVFAAGFVIGGEARIAKTDAALLACTLVAQAALVRLWLQEGVNRLWIYAFWLGLAVAALIKGPIGPMVPALTILVLVVWQRRAGWLRPLASALPILLALAVVLPWFVAITLRSEGAFWQASVGADMMAKVVAGQEGKGAPPGTYTLLMFFTFWPGAALLILTAPRIWAARRQAGTAFLIAWALPVWLVFEAVPTKLIHYTMPALPALALLALGHLPQALRVAPGWQRALAGIALLPGLAVGAAVIYAASLTGGTFVAIWIMACGLALALAAICLGWRALMQRQDGALVLATIAAGAILHAALFPALARMPVLWPTQSAMALAEGIAAAQGCARPKLASWGYTEPSVVWRGGRDTRLFAAETDAAAVIAPGPCEVVFRRLEGASPLPPAGCQLAGTVEGMAIGAGRWVRLQVLDCRGAP